jgi:hypothetical protein
MSRCGDAKWPCIRPYNCCMDKALDIGMHGRWLNYAELAEIRHIAIAA